MTEPLSHGYSSESTQRELSNEYQHYMIKMDFKDSCILALCTKVGSALEGLNPSCDTQYHEMSTMICVMLIYVFPFKVRIGVFLSI